MPRLIRRDRDGLGYVIAVLIGLALPGAAVALYFGITVSLIVPFREVARLLSRRP